MKNSNWATNIGLEIHAQIKTDSKMFSTDSAFFSSLPNDCIHPVSLGLPGTLPVLNKKVIQSALKVGKAFHCDIQNKSVFARKNYFYPDLPKGYQISQYSLPLLKEGYIEFYHEDVYTKVPLERVHLEEDAGRLVHQKSYSLVDFNRAGTPLIEIVSKPEMTSPRQAASYAKMVRLILIYLGVCDGHLQEGSIRFDCNVSLRPKDNPLLGTKVEIKNLNSFRFMERALSYEVKRQQALLEKGKLIQQETRLYNSKKNETYPMRSKEEASDYRYFPEPDLPVLKVGEDVPELKLELPFEKIKRYKDHHNIPLDSAVTIASDLSLYKYFESAAEKTSHKQILAKWICNEILGYLTDNKLSTDQIAIPPEQIAGLVELIYKKTLTSKMAKNLLPKLWNTKKDIQELVKELGLKKMDDIESISKVVDQVLEEFKEQVEQYNQGKTSVIKFLVGQVMKKSKGQADPEKTNQILLKKLQK